MSAPAKFTFTAELGADDEALFGRAVFNASRPDLAALRALRFNKMAFISHVVAGAIGEAYLNVYARQWLKSHPDTEFVEERQLSLSAAEQTQTHKVPDGLIVRRQGRRLYLVKILESRMRGQRYRPSKMEAALRGWQKYGIRLADGAHYSANKIYFESGARLDQLVLANPEHFQKAERAVVIFLSRSRPQDAFQGTIVETPFSGIELSELTIRFIFLTYTGETQTPAEIDLLIKNTAESNRTSPNVSAWTFNLTQDLSRLLPTTNAPVPCPDLVEEAQ